jgi:predicted dehydrogenase
MARLEGREGSYGAMKLEYYQRGLFERPDDPDTQFAHDFGATDASLTEELEDFGRAVQGEEPIGRLSSPEDGWGALAVADAVYAGGEEIPQLSR